MARPIKKGLDYFPVDTDIFENIQVRKLKSRYKASGFLVYFTILCDVYKKEGYFLQLSDDYVYDLSDRIGETEERVQEVIEFCLQADLFNRQKYELYKVITSKSIQVRYIQAQKRCKNPVREELDCINVTETPVIVAETTENTTESAHIILDNIKVNTERECVREESVEIPEKSFNEKCATWQKELLEDEEWCASAVRQSGIGADFYAMLPPKMQEFQDFIVSNDEKESINSKKDYARRFHFWWLYHGAKNHSGGGANTFQLRGKPERKSRVEELMETGKRATEIALKIYNSQVV
ncbi:DUF4373 domain-containing protein [Parabacteroides timonensis]|uniref:DUF4373 domain-containing protein n=1 Tax=Parabacteroides timonensis TaxID=1871013 RepID=UPI0009E48F32|nr:DUF4373 domain-containing protein [Parabacteroides timonensis]